MFVAIKWKQANSAELALLIVRLYGVSAGRPTEIAYCQRYCVHSEAEDAITCMSIDNSTANL